jgi:hemimethylated DNA binding protein
MRTTRCKSNIAIATIVACLCSAAATIISIDWVQHSTAPSPSDSPDATLDAEDLPVIFPEFPSLFSDATWRSYLEFSKRALNQASAFKHVKYSPGTVFKHRLFGYRGVIMGATPSCEASEQWIQQMRVDDLPGGRKQPFYWTMVDVRDRPVQTTYVAESNVIPISTQVLHPDVSSIFRSYSSDVGRYVPLDRSVDEVASEVLPLVHRCARVFTHYLSLAALRHPGDPQEQSCRTPHKRCRPGARSSRKIWPASHVHALPRN